MKLKIDGVLCVFTPIKQFRETYTLPETFGVGHFEPKDYTGLASIDTAGNDMHALREAVLKAIPATLTLPELMPFADSLTQLFRTQLYAINDTVNLKDVEIEFAVAGFSDVCQAFFYDRIRAQSSKTTPQPFDVYYGAWLNDSVRVNQHQHSYDHDGNTWAVQVINHAYGRVGFVVDTGDSRHYVADSALACPAEGYMFGLLREVSNKLDKALAGDE